MIFLIKGLKIIAYSNANAIKKAKIKLQVLIKIHEKHGNGKQTMKCKAQLQEMNKSA